MRVLRAGIGVLGLVVAGMGWSGSAMADASGPAIAQECPQHGGWILYRVPDDGGSAGIHGLYTADHGSCVSFFMQNPSFLFLTVTHSNPPPGP